MGEAGDTVWDEQGGCGIRPAREKGQKLVTAGCRCRVKTPAFSLETRGDKAVKPVALAQGEDSGPLPAAPVCSGKLGRGCGQGEGESNLL